MPFLTSIPDTHASYHAAVRFSQVEFKGLSRLTLVEPVVPKLILPGFSFVFTFASRETQGGFERVRGSSFLRP